MPKIFPLIVKKTVVVISTVNNWLSSIKPALKASFGPSTFRIATQKPAAQIKMGPSTLRAATQKPALAVTATATGNPAKTVVKPAAQVRMGPSTFLSATQKAALLVKMAAATLRAANQKPAAKISQIRVDLSMLRYVATAAVDAGSTGTWNNPNNIVGAEQGTQAGSATFAGGLLLGTGNLRELTWATFGARPSTLVIDEVYLRFHYQTTGLPLVSDLISSLALVYRINTSPLATTDGTIASVTSNDNFLVAGREFRIDDGAGNFVGPIPSTAVTWANLALLQAAFKATTIANGLMTYFADAIRLRVVAHEVWVP